MAMFNLGGFYYNGFYGIKKDYSMAVSLFQQCCVTDNDYSSSATRQLGICYELGRGVSKNPVKAFQLYTKAANDDDAEAQMYLGHCYNEGIGIEVDKQKAQEWFSKAMSKYLYESQERKSEGAYIQMGICYENGWGVNKDYLLAIFCFRQSSAPTAKYHIGLCYYNGTGVTRDYSQAFKLFYDASTSEFPSSLAMQYLSRCYRFGRGVSQNIAKADEWLRKSLEGDDETLSILNSVH